MNILTNYKLTFWDGEIKNLFLNRRGIVGLIEIFGKPFNLILVELFSFWFSLIQRFEIVNVDQ